MESFFESVCFTCLSKMGDRSNPCTKINLPKEKIRKAEGGKQK